MATTQTLRSHPSQTGLPHCGPRRRSLRPARVNRNTSPHATCPLLAHRDMLRRRTMVVANGAKQTSASPRSLCRIDQSMPWSTRGPFCRACRASATPYAPRACWREPEPRSREGWLANRSRGNEPAFAFRASSGNLHRFAAQVWLASRKLRPAQPSPFGLRRAALRCFAAKAGGR